MEDSVIQNDNNGTNVGKSEGIQAHFIDITENTSNKSNTLILNRANNLANQNLWNINENSTIKNTACRHQGRDDGDSGFLTELFTKRDRNQSPIKSKEATG